jgi:phytoene/squalene synthetase
MTAQNELEKAYKYCERVTKTHAKSFYFAAKFLPKHKQKPIYALYALCRHVDDDVDEVGVSNKQEAIKAVEEWRQKLLQVFAVQSLKIENSQLLPSLRLSSFQSAKRCLMSKPKIKQLLKINFSS